MNNQECKVRSQIVNVNIDDPVFYSFSIKRSKCSGSSWFVKNLNIKAFNLMSRTNEARHIKWHETCKCKCRLDASVCINKQRWNDDKCRCECKKLIDKGVRDKEFIWNSSNCEFECDKSCDVGKYLDYENYNCRKKLVGYLIDECIETINEEKSVERNCVCGFCVVHIVFLSTCFLISLGLFAFKKTCSWCQF